MVEKLHSRLKFDLTLSMDRYLEQNRDEVRQRRKEVATLKHKLLQLRKRLNGYVCMYVHVCIYTSNSCVYTCIYTSRLATVGIINVLGSLIMRDTLLHTLILSSMYTKFIQDALLYIVFMYIHSIMY